MRVEPVWVADDQLAPSIENIKHWRPIDEPDVPAETPEGTHVMAEQRDQRRRHRQLRPVRPRPGRARAQRGRDDPAGHPPGARPDRRHDRRHRLHLLGQLRLPGRSGLQLRDDARRGRRLAADHREPRRDGRRLGAVRGLAEDPGRPRRHRAGLRLLARRRPATCPACCRRQLDPYYYAPLWPDSVAIAGLQARAHARHRHASPRPRWPGSRIATARRPGQPPRPGARARRRSTSCWREDFLSDPLRRPRLPADLRRRRRRSSSPPATGPGSGSTRPAWIRGIDHRIDSHNFGARDLDACPVASPRRRRRPACSDGKVDVAELHAPFTHQEKIVRDGAGPRRRRRGQPVGWARWPPTR